MFRTFNAATRTEVQRPHRAAPLLELWQLVVDQTATWAPTLCVVADVEPVVFGGVTFHPFPVERSEITWDDDGSLPTCQLRLANASRAVARWVDEGRGFVGMPATMWTGLREQIGQPGGVVAVGWTIAEASLDDEFLVLELGARGVVPLDMPVDRMTRTRCGWRFRSPECGYEPDPALGANYRTCDKSLSDCVARGADEFARGLPRIHPQQFGGFPGLPAV